MALPQKIFIKQKVEALEIFTGFETKNRYRVMNEQGNDLFYAFEESNFFARQLLSVVRPLKVNIIDKNKTPYMTVERQFFFFLAKHEVKNAGGQLLGTIRQRWKWFGSKFELYDASGQLVLTCIRKFPKIWTFNIFQQGAQVGQILKKWSGFGKEMFTDADTFMADFGTVKNDNLKYLILAAVFAIDLRVFERK